MSISYQKLWVFLAKNNMTKTQMRIQAQISTNVLARLGKGKTVSLESLMKICQTLKCDIGDIVEYHAD